MDDQATPMLPLEQLQDVLRRLDPTRPVQDEHERGWYVERPDGVGALLGRSLQLEPTSSHLVVGPIGCGKSTELLAAARRLDAATGVVPRYIEVSTAMDLGAGDSIALAIAIVDDLVRTLTARYPDEPRLKRVQAELTPWVSGGWDPYWDAPRYDDHGGYFPPRLKRPQGIPDDLEPHLGFLAEVAAVVGDHHRGAHLVLLLDGLDRLSDPVEFDRIVEPFLGLLKAASIGVAIVGPRRVIAGANRLGAAASFDEIHWMGPTDPDPNGPGWPFLNHVLEARGVDEIVPEPERHALIRHSGGAIRMLLQLTREAIKTTWVHNAASLTVAQVEAAADKVGRSLLLGLTDSDLAVLRTLLETGVYAPRTTEESTLALTNRVLEYQTPSGLPRHALHPTLVPFVKALGKPSEPTHGTAARASA